MAAENDPALAEAISEAEEALECVYAEGHPAHVGPRTLAWTREDVPISAFLHPGMFPDLAGMALWHDEELAGAERDGWTGRVEDVRSMVADGIRVPVSCAVIDGLGWMYGGHHRLAAAAKRGDATVPAWVGRPRAAGATATDAR